MDDTKKNVSEEAQGSSPSEFEQCRKERDEYLAGWQRARADFANFRKDEAQRVSELVRFSQEGLLSELLLVLDSFDLAAASISQDAGEYKSFSLVQSQLAGILKRHGLEEIVPQVGNAFDPTMHEAVETVDHEHARSGTVAALVYKGYTYQGKVLRPARVKIAN